MRWINCWLRLFERQEQQHNPYTDANEKPYCYLRLHLDCSTERNQRLILPAPCDDAQIRAENEVSSLFPHGMTEYIEEEQVNLDGISSHP